MVQQEPPSRPDRFGTLSVSNTAPILDQSRPAIYWEADTVQFSGVAHARFLYVWCFPSPLESGVPGQGPNNASSRRTEAGLPLQGIRITLDSVGQPVIWEVLADNFKAKLFFVSQNLETAAIAGSASRFPDGATQSNAAWRRPPT